MRFETLAERLLQYMKSRLNNEEISYKSPPEQIQGGFETSIFSFQLLGAENTYSRRLVLRLYPEYYGSWNAVWESTVQNVLAGQDYPVAKTHLLCTDESILGGAFFIMDFLPGVPMLNTPIQGVPEFLGKIHATLHNLDPQPVYQALCAAGINERRLHFDNHFHWLKEKTNKFSWLRKASVWLIENLPAEPQQLAVCHGDLHPLNILVNEAGVTGVLDWPGFIIADPALDIAATLVLLTIPYKNLAPTLRPDLADVDFDSVAQEYLSAYQTERSFDASHLPYFRVRRCVHALVQGIEGQVSWQHTGIVKDMCDYIFDVTGIQMNLP